MPIAVQLGFNPLHFGIIMILAMGFGLFSPPIGLGLYTTCAICGVEMKHVIRPMAKYLAVVLVGIIIVAMVPPLTTWLPGWRVTKRCVNRVPGGTAAMPPK
ncbi:TRAP-type C4-dicarboxylate transport system, small permease component [Raoultella terrigena]|uniref:TRAP-type C4-dicarboxylate transport system, small permease component n=1 Tax=Raoultella terrigena TaxID=577 RepID=A0A3P8M4E8_RAOTE|nr:TRAP-type C4-dicarboxylate transport system, small permease component [Raoultella terrigena]